MAKFAKWIGGGLAWALTGGSPIGAMIGFAIGSAIDNVRVDSNNSGQQTGRHQTQAGDFGVSLLILSAAVMKADGKILKSELTYVKEFFNKQFGFAKTTEFMKILKGVLEQDINLKDICGQIRFNMQHPMRLQMLHFLFGIAKADGNVDDLEAEYINLFRTALKV